jgi:DNA-binding response OmpR family regulator
MKVLIVEDEQDLADSIQLYLQGNGFVCDMALDFNDAKMFINLYKYDCIIVDITLPDGSGLDIIKELKKKKSNTGVIIISAKNALNDKVNGLSIGADDYMTKPFHLAELNARIKALIRRREFEGNPEIVFGEISINPEKSRVIINGQLLKLTKKEFGLLLYFISNKNRVITKETIAEHLWGSTSELMDSFEFIYSHVKNLRKKLIMAGAQDYISTVYGVGYRFEEK